MLIRNCLVSSKQCLLNSQIYDSYLALFGFYFPILFYLRCSSLPLRSHAFQYVRNRLSLPFFQPSVLLSFGFRHSYLLLFSFSSIGYNLTPAFWIIIQNTCFYENLDSFTVARIVRLTFSNPSHREADTESPFLENVNCEGK